MSNAIPVSAPSSLEQDDMNAFSFLARAANAIVRASDLSRETTYLTERVDHLNETVSTLSEARASLEQTLGDTCTALREANATIDGLRKDQSADGYKIHELITRLNEVINERDHAYNSLRRTEEALGRLQDEHYHLGEAYGDAASKLAKFREILGLPPEPEPTLSKPEARVDDSREAEAHVIEEESVKAYIEKQQEPGLNLANILPSREYDEYRASHGSPELDEDAQKLEAMGHDSGPTLEEYPGDVTDPYETSGPGKEISPYSSELDRVIAAQGEYTDPFQYQNS